MAAEAEHSAVCELLLSRGADVNAFEKSGLTRDIGRLAIRDDRMPLFRVLLEQGHFGRILRPGLAVSGPQCARLAPTLGVYLDKESLELAESVVRKQVAVVVALEKTWSIPKKLVEKIGRLTGLPWI
jgi:hypothetical protein